MAQIILTADNAIVPRLLAAYGVADNASLKAAIIKDIKQKIVAHETYLASSQEQAKIEAAENARRVAVATAESTASSEIVLN